MQSCLIQQLRDFQRGRPQALLLRVRQPCRLDEITTIQQYLQLSRVRKKPHAQARKISLLPQLHYHLFLHFNRQLAQPCPLAHGPHRRFKQRMYIVKYVAKQCYSRSKTLAMNQIRAGTRYQGWQPMP